MGSAVVVVGSAVVPSPRFNCGEVLFMLVVGVGVVSDSSGEVLFMLVVDVGVASDG